MAEERHRKLDDVMMMSGTGNRTTNLVLFIVRTSLVQPSV